MSVKNDRLRKLDGWKMVRTLHDPRQFMVLVEIDELAHWVIRGRAVAGVTLPTESNVRKV